LEFLNRESEKGEVRKEKIRKNPSIPSLFRRCGEFSGICGSSLALCGGGGHFSFGRL
jgi:hypothetical protein